MRLALVDNLTLDAVQKLLGQVVSYYYDDPKDMIKEDVIAFDNLLHAILFSDDVIYIEGFMPEYNEANRFGPYFPSFKQYRIGVVAYRTIVKDINDEYALKYDSQGDLQHTPAFYSFEFMKQHIQLPVVNRLEYGTLIYHTISANLGSDLVLFPTRATFQRKLMDDLVSKKECHKPVHFDGNQKVSPKDTNNPVIQAYRVPMFIAWLAENYKDISRFIEIANKMRNKKEFRDIRKTLDRLRACYETTGPINRDKAHKLEIMLREQFYNLTEKYKVTTHLGKVERNLSIGKNLKSINQNFIPVPGLTYPPPTNEAPDENELKAKYSDEEILGFTDYFLGFQKGEEIGAPTFFHELLQYETYDVLPRQEHNIYLSDLEDDKKQLDKLGIIYDYIIADLVLVGSEKAKLLKEAELLKKLKAHEEEARGLYNELMTDPVVDPQNLINRKELQLSSQTLKYIKNLKEEEHKKFEKEKNHS